MPDITLDECAIERLMLDPSLQDWREGVCARRLPILRHQHRHSTTTADGAVIRRGDFFLLTTIDPQDAIEMNGLVFTTAALPNGCSILVGGDATVIANTAEIAWSNEMFKRRRGLKQA